MSFYQPQTSQSNTTKQLQALLSLCHPPTKSRHVVYFDLPFFKAIKIPKKSVINSAVLKSHHWSDTFGATSIRVTRGARSFDGVSPVRRRLLTICNTCSLIFHSRSQSGATVRVFRGQAGEGPSSSAFVSSWVIFGICSGLLVIKVKT